MCDGRVEISLLQVGCPQVGAVAGVRGAKLKRRFELRDGAGRVAALDQCQTQIVVRIRIVGTELNQLPESRDCARGVTRTLQHFSELGLGLNKPGLKLDRCLHFLNGFLRLPHFFQHASQIEMRLRVLRQTSDGALQ